MHFSFGYILLFIAAHRHRLSSWAEANSSAEDCPPRHSKKVLPRTVLDRWGSFHGMNRLEMEGRKPRAWRRPGGVVWVAGYRPSSRAKGLRVTGERWLTRSTDAPMAGRVPSVACLLALSRRQIRSHGSLTAPSRRFARVMPLLHVGRHVPWAAGCLYCSWTAARANRSRRRCKYATLRPKQVL